MLPRRKPWRLALEQLEDRTCLSLAVSLTSSGLLLTGRPSGAVQITGAGAVGSNMFTILDGTNNLGTYPVPRDLRVNLLTRPGDFNINLNQRVIPGSVVINLGNGYVGPQTSSNAVNVYDLTTTTTPNGGTVRGSLTVLNGNGLEWVNVGILRDTTGTETSHAITVAGSVLDVGRAADVSGMNASDIVTGDTLNVGGGTQLLGSLTAAQVENISYGVTTEPAAHVGGSFSAVESGPGGPMAVGIHGNIDGSLSVNDTTPTSSFNNFTIDFINNGVESPVIGGNVSVSFADALFGNLFNVGVSGAAVQPTINGSVSLTSTSGLTPSSLPDDYTINSTIGGNLIISAPEAPSQLEIDTTAAVLGNAVINGGNGGFDMGNTFTLAGSVGGNFSVNLGNGTNSFITTPAGAGSLHVGGALSVQMGNGTGNVETLGAGSSVASLFVKTGTGGNTLTLDPAATFGRATIIGAPFANNVLIANGTISVPFQISGY
jgi:hypothetical protein